MGVCSGKMDMFKGDKPESKWQPGNWVAHVTGMEPKLRLEAVR